MTDVATARHHVANALHGYAGIADRKDLDAVMDMMGHAHVRFPTASAATPDEVRSLYAALWDSPQPHRHDVTTLVVTQDDSVPPRWVGRAHYTRWILDDRPTLHTLGEYTMVVDDESWEVRSLTVTRTWTAG